MVGCAGSGKTWLGERLAERGWNHVELDQALWQPGWQRVDLDEVRRLVHAIDVPCTAIEGDLVREGLDCLAGTYFDQVLWLDTPRWFATASVVRRTLLDLVRRRDRWPGCRETWRHAMGPDSFVLEAWRSFQSQRTEYERLYREQAWSPREWTVLKSRSEVLGWLNRLTPCPKGG